MLLQIEYSWNNEILDNDKIQYIINQFHTKKFVRFGSMLEFNPAWYHW
jgi:hypothetical protein